jgi:hypothetical protein
MVINVVAPAPSTSRYVVGKSNGVLLDRFSQDLLRARFELLSEVFRVVTKENRASKRKCRANMELPFLPVGIVRICIQAQHEFLNIVSGLY